MTSSEGVLGRWSAFPATAQPRPIVLVQGYVRVQEGGFLDGNAKRAFAAGALEAAPGVTVPDAVLTLLHGGAPFPAGPALQITDVTIRQIPFNTDRGPVPLSSYLLSITGAAQPVIVLDPNTAVWWPPAPAAEARGVANSASVDDDQRTLHVRVSGGVLTEFLGCDFIETDTAVLPRPITRQRPSRGPAIPAVLIGRKVTGRLRQPLGGRVLITAHGDPMMVKPTDSANG